MKEVSMIEQSRVTKPWGKLLLLDLFYNKFDRNLIEVDAKYSETLFPLSSIF